MDARHYKSKYAHLIPAGALCREGVQQMDGKESLSSLEHIVSGPLHFPAGATALHYFNTMRVKKKNPKK